MAAGIECKKFHSLDIYTIFQLDNILLNFKLTPIPVIITESDLFIFQNNHSAYIMLIQTKVFTMVFQQPQNTPFCEIA